MKSNNLITQQKNPIPFPSVSDQTGGLVSGLSLSHVLMRFNFLLTTSIPDAFPARESGCRQPRRRCRRSGWKGQGRGDALRKMSGGRGGRWGVFGVGGFVRGAWGAASRERPLMTLSATAGQESLRTITPHCMPHCPGTSSAQTLQVVDFNHSPRERGKCERVRERKRVISANVREIFCFSSGKRPHGVVEKKQAKEWRHGIKIVPRFLRTVAYSNSVQMRWWKSPCY